MSRYPKIIYYRCALQAFLQNFYNLLPTFVNSLPLATILRQLFRTIYHKSVNWSDTKKSLYFAKKLLYSLKIVIRSSLLYFVYVPELFSISWKKILQINIEPNIK